MDKSLIIIPNPNNYIDQEMLKEKGYVEIEDVVQIARGISMDLAFNPQVKSIMPRGLNHVDKVINDIPHDVYVFSLELTKVDEKVLPINIQLIFQRSDKGY